MDARRIVLRSIIVASTVCIINSSLYAQYGHTKTAEKQQAYHPFVIQDIDVERLRESTESGQSSQVTPSRFDAFWYKIGVYYSSELQWADGVEVKYYVLMQEKRTDSYSMLTGDVKYDSVPRGNDLRSFVYIHPRTAERYGKPERVMCEIWHDGVRVDRSVWPRGTDNEWWVRNKPITGNLKLRFFTPFALDRDAREENINIKSIFE